MNKGFEERLIARRQVMGLSQEQVAIRLGLTRQAISRWERGESVPDLDNLIKLSEVYQTTVDGLLAIEKQDEDCGLSLEETPSKSRRPLYVVLACMALLLIVGVFALLYKPLEYGFIRGEIVSLVHPAAGYTSNELVVKNESGTWGEPVFLVFTPNENTEVVDEDDLIDIQKLRVGDVVEVTFRVKTRNVDSGFELPALIAPDKIQLVNESSIV